jgi:predicted acyl esterase
MNALPAGYGIVICEDLMVPMRDGVRLATDVYRPAREGEILPSPFPALLWPTPYVKDSARYVEIAPSHIVLPIIPI